LSREAFFENEMRIRVLFDGLDSCEVVMYIYGTVGVMLGYSNHAVL
jgi:hypothetical protein